MNKQHIHIKNDGKLSNWPCYNFIVLWGGPTVSQLS